MSEEKNPKVKKVSKKKILFIEIDEEITRIFERIEKISYKEIYLVVPKRAILLQSVVNLKILKQKLEDIGKTMFIITNDANGMNLANQAEIKIFDHWSVDNGKKKESESNTSTLLTPIAATSNEIGDDSPSRLPKKKSSIFEVVRTLRGKEKGFSLKSYLHDRKKSRMQKEPFQIYLTGSTKKLITGLVASSVVIFGLIAYFVLPGATLYIEPASNVVTKAVNIDLLTNPDDPRSLKVYPIETDVEWTVTHPATGIISEGSTAAGNITVINNSLQEWPLISQTRFQTDDGLVYRLQEAATVPSGSADSPGSLVVYVVADALDANGLPIGERGNIGPSTFFLPGLREDSRENLYAESYDNITGGETNVTSYVLEEDLIAAREKLEAELEEKVLSALRKETLSQSNSLAISLTLLEDSDVLQYGSPLVDMPYDIVGQEMSDFEMTGSMNIKGIAYDSEELLLILKTEIITAETPGKSLVKIDDESISIDVLESDNFYSTYKFTAQIQGIEEYEIDPDLEGGSKLAKKIKEHISGKTIEEATNYVQNLPEVNTVEIKMWPVWSPTIPTLPENIKIKSTSDGEALEL